MSIEQDIQAMLAESKKIETVTVDEEALKPEAGTEEPNVKKANEKQTVVQKAVATGVDNEKPDGGHDQSTDKNEAYDATDDVAALVNGEDLSEEFKTKAATIFEAAVVTRVKEGLAKIEESYEARLNEEVETVKQGLVEKVDGYLDYIVEQWISDNEVALTHGVKVEVMENFLQGLKTLFVENYVDIPEDKFDVVAEMESKLDSLEAQLAESETEKAKLAEQVNESKRNEIIESATDGLSEASVEKFKDLAQELVFENEDSFTAKLKIIKENYFSKTKPLTEQHVETVITDAPVLEEDVKPTKAIDRTIANYAEVLNKSIR